MSTWNGTPFKASVSVFKNGWETDEDHEFKWFYQTTADCLTIYENNEMISGGDYSMSRILWVLMDDWARTYMGEHEMKELRKKYGTSREKD